VDLVPTKGFFRLFGFFQEFGSHEITYKIYLTVRSTSDVKYLPSAPDRKRSDLSLGRIFTEASRSGDYPFWSFKVLLRVGQSFLSSTAFFGFVGPSSERK